ncbi:MAG: LysM peptidoglycan-binding domain-containing protein [Syntrophobacterales bacterium]|nr:LysM peptidoglycan-binding domain-containing protein [Syntrophobacterales bacterium]
MNKQNLQGCFLIVIFFLILTYPLTAFSKEDTAYISFKRVGISKHQTETYVVKKDEWLLEIIRNKYDVSEKEAYRILNLVKRVNPELRNMNAIYPGQKLLFPKKRPSKTVSAAHPSPNMLSDKKKEKVILKYVVKKGDSISNIVYRKFGGSRGEIYRILGLIKRLNPGVKNLNRIYPGQTLSFPRAIRDIIQSPFRDKGVTIPEYKILPVISHVINRMYGVVITDGSYCIPVPPSGEVKIDCSKVSVIEINEGNIILLDLSNRIPADLRRIIESTWKNYRVISLQEGEGISSILERVINATGVYEIRKINRYEKVGNTPVVKVFIEWLVSKKPRFRGTGSYAFNFVSKSSQLVPFSVKDYAQRNDLEIIEIMDGLGIAADEKISQSCTARALNSVNSIEMANSLLEMLGYSPVKDSTIDILIGNGLTLSVKADLLLNIDGGRIIITSSRLSDQVVNILQKRSDRVVFIPEEKSRRKVIEDIARVMKIPCLNNDFKFPLSRRNGKENGDISLPALRLGDEEILYLVDYDVDKEICGLLNKEYTITLVRY